MFLEVNAKQFPHLCKMFLWVSATPRSKTIVINQVINQECGKKLTYKPRLSSICYFDKMPICKKSSC